MTSTHRGVLAFSAVLAFGAAIACALAACPLPISAQQPTSSEPAAAGQTAGVWSPGAGFVQFLTGSAFAAFVERHTSEGQIESVEGWVAVGTLSTLALGVGVNTGDGPVRVGAGALFLRRGTSAVGLGARLALRKVFGDAERPYAFSLNFRPYLTTDGYAPILTLEMRVLPR